MPTLSADPEARFGTACLLARLDQRERALELLSAALESGYLCHHALLNDRWLHSLRGTRRFSELVDRAERLGANARNVFLANRGDRLLGVA